jgi:hypothetical protein
MRHASLSHAAAQGHIADLLREADASRLAAKAQRGSAPGSRLGARFGRRLRHRPGSISRALGMTGEPLRLAGSGAAPHH